MEKGNAPEPWEIESSERVHRYGIFDVRRDRVRSPRNGQLHDFALVAASDGVTVIAITPEEELVMVQQYRHGVRRVCLETPSGLMEEGEDPMEAARRELREETGYEFDEGRTLGAVAINPSWETAHAHVVVGRGARCVTGQDLDPGEDPRTRLVPLPEVWARVTNGEIRSGVVLSALLLHRLEDPKIAGGQDDS